VRLKYFLPKGKIVIFLIYGGTERTYGDTKRNTLGSVMYHGHKKNNGFGPHNERTNQTLMRHKVMLH